MHAILNRSMVVPLMWLPATASLGKEGVYVNDLVDEDAIVDLDVWECDFTVFPDEAPLSPKPVPENVYCPSFTVPSLTVPVAKRGPKPARLCISPRMVSFCNSARSGSDCRPPSWVIVREGERCPFSANLPPISALLNRQVSRTEERPIVLAPIVAKRCPKPAPIHTDMSNKQRKLEAYRTAKAARAAPVRCEIANRKASWEGLFNDSIELVQDFTTATPTTAVTMEYMYSAATTLVGSKPVTPTCSSFVPPYLPVVISKRTRDDFASEVSQPVQKKLRRMKAFYNLERSGRVGQLPNPWPAVV